MNREELLRIYAAGKYDFSELNLSHINLSGTNLTGADLSGTNLTGADLSGADLTGAVLIETNLNGADLTNTILEDALFCRTIMPYGSIKSDSSRILTVQQLLKLYAAGERKFPSIVISRADLRNKNLRGINLFDPKSSDYPIYRSYLLNSDLSDANLEGSLLENISFRKSNLSSINLSEATLRSIDFTDVNLRDANFSRADTERIDFTRTDLAGARIAEHSLYWLITFENTTLPNGKVIVERTFHSD